MNSHKENVMTAANRSQFVYVTYIKTTQAKLWEALTDPKFIPQYWFGVNIDCDWKKGSSWKMAYPDGRMTDSGEILEIDPPRRMVIRWMNRMRPELTAEGWSRCTIELEPAQDAMKLSITHEIDKPESELIKAVSGGWPRIMANLKSLLETGSVVWVEKVGCASAQ